MIKVLAKVCYRQNFKRDICAWELGISIQICIVWHVSHSNNKKIDQLFRFGRLTDKNQNGLGKLASFILRQTASIFGPFCSKISFSLSQIVFDCYSSKRYLFANPSILLHICILSI